MYVYNLHYLGSTFQFSVVVDTAGEKSQLDEKFEQTLEGLSLSSSTLTPTLTLTPTPTLTPLYKRGAQQGRKKILVVEDNPMNQKIIEKHLRVYILLCE